jgi:hypothetical protein
MSIWGMTEDEIMRILRSRGESETRSRELEEILHGCNKARYSTEKPDVRIFMKQLKATRRILRSIRVV